MADLSSNIRKLELALFDSREQTDKQLFQEEGQQVEAVICQLREANKDEKRKIMGPVISKFCSEYLDMWKAIWDGSEIKFRHGWELAPAADVKMAGSKGKAPERPAQKLPKIDLNNPPRQDKVSIGSYFNTEWPGTWKQDPLDPRTKTSVEQPVAPSPKTLAEQPIKLKNTGCLHLSALGSFKDPGSLKNPGSFKSLGSTSDSGAEKHPGPWGIKENLGETKGSSKTPGLSTTLAVKPSGIPQKKPAKPSENMDVDEPTKSTQAKKAWIVVEIPGKKPGETSKAGGGKGKEKETAPRQKAHTEREEYKHGEASYDPAENSSAGEYEDKAVGTNSEVPIITQQKLIKKPGENIVVKKATEEGSKCHSNFYRFLPAPTVKFLQDIKVRKSFMAAEKEEYDVWLKNIIKTNPELEPKKERSNTSRAVVLLGPTLVPPTGLVKNNSSCDYCKEYCPFRCFVLDQGTSCLMCNFFHHVQCKKDGKRVMDKASKMSKGKASETTKGKASETSKGKASETTKGKAGKTSKGKASQKSKEKPVLDQQLWAEMQFTQAQQGSAIQAIQSQMDAMTLGMAACGSLLKDAKQKVQYHSSIRTGVDETVADGSKTLAESIEKIIAGRDQLEQISPGVPHHMLEDHIKNLNALVSLGVEFSQTFQALAKDAHRVTVALGEWLQGS
ncbi:hypothetical protein H1R20_g1175, partial [Candolleomyces eurysporus]